MTDQIINLPIYAIHRDRRFQPRDDVDPDFLCNLDEVDKMRHAAVADGQASGWDPAKAAPIDVWMDPGTNGSDPVHVLLHGYHRFALAQAAGISEIACKVHSCSIETAIKISERGNLSTRQLAPMEEARIFKARLDRGETAGAIAADLDRRSPSAIDRRALLAYLTPVLQDAVANKTLKVEYAEAIGEAAREGELP